MSINNIGIIDSGNNNLLEESINVGFNIIDEHTEFSSLSLLLIHRNDKEVLMKQDNKGFLTYKPIISNIWKVYFGGNDTSAKPIDNNNMVIEYIGRNELRKKLTSINTYVNNNELDAVKLYTIIFGIDFNLEDLLKPFEHLDPFQGFADLADSIEELNNYIDKKYGIRNK